MMATKKKTLKSSHDSNLAPPNSNQMLLPTGPPFIGANSKHSSFRRKAMQSARSSDGTYRVAAATSCWWQHKVIGILIMQSKNTNSKYLRIKRCLWIMPSILRSNARAPVAQLVRPSEDPGLIPSWISNSFLRHQCIFVVSGEIVHNPIGNLTDIALWRHVIESSRQTASYHVTVSSCRMSVVHQPAFISAAV